MTESVYLIHGTGNPSFDSKSPKWWQPNSEFVRNLRAKLGERYVVIPQRVAGEGPEIFTWSGNNSERARREAGIALYHWLKVRPAAPFHIISHSHGGSVFWHALLEAERNRDPLLNLQSWTSLGTPFLLFTPASVVYWLTPVLIVGLLSTIAVVTHSIVTSTEAMFHYMGPSLIALSVNILLIFAIIALLIGGFCYVMFALIATLHLYQRRGFEKAALARYLPKFLPLWHGLDEPIIGLGASLASPAKFVPRQTKRYQSSENLGPFNYAAARWRWTTLFAPVAMVMDWIVAPTIDQLVWVTLMRKLQGSDIPGIMCSQVSTSISNTVVHPLTAIQSKEIDDFIVGPTPEVAANFRQSLSTIWRNGKGSELLDNLPPGLWNAIIHTSYFDSNAIQEMIADHIRASAYNGALAPALISEDESNTRTSGHAWHPRLLNSVVAFICVAVPLLFASLLSANTYRFVYPYVNEYQLRMISAKVMGGQFPSVSSPNVSSDGSEHLIGDILIDIDILGLLRDYKTSLDNMHDGSEAVYAAQRLAYSWAYAGKWDEVASLSNYSRPVALGEEKWSLVKPAILLHGAYGLRDAGRSIDVNLLKNVLSSAEAAEDSDIAELAMALFRSLNRIDYAQQVLKSLGDYETNCPTWQDGLKKAPEDVFLKAAVDTCEEVTPESFDTQVLTPESGDNGGMDKPTVGNDTGSEQPAGQLRASKLLNNINMLLLKADDKRKDVRIIVNKYSVRSIRWPLTYGESKILWVAQSKLRSLGMSDAADRLTESILSRQLPAPLEPLEMAEIRYDSVVQLLRIGEKRRAAVFVSDLDNSTHSFVLGDNGDFGLMGKEIEIGKLRFMINESSWARALTSNVNLLVQRIPLELLDFKSATSFARWCAGFDKPCAVSLLNVALQIASNQPDKNSRLIMYAEIARIWTEMNELLVARSVVEKENELVAINPSIHDAEASVYVSDTIKIGGMLGGYLMILDATVDKRQLDERSKYAAGDTQRATRPFLVELE